MTEIKTVTLVGNTVCIDETDFDTLINCANAYKNYEKQITELQERVRLTDKVIEKGENLIDWFEEVEAVASMHYMYLMSADEYKEALKDYNNQD